jgi:glycosyltransferase involved in cell wall biosynthesis
LITFAVVGHNEAALLPNALEQAQEASRAGDCVWFVDSASTDGSAEVARSVGVEVVEASLGKGRAVAAAVERCRTSHICLLDADIEGTSANVAADLRQALERGRADQIVWEFEWPEKSFRPVTAAIWEPLAGELFPEAVAAVPRVPLSGFRILDVSLARGPLPTGFGLEVHLNIVGSLDGRRTETLNSGVYTGPVRSNPELPAEVGAAILDAAERLGRLDPSARPSWDEWLAPVLELIARTTPDDRAGRKRIMELAARPLPGRG